MWKSPSPVEGAEAGLSKRIKAADETARHELVRHNLGLACTPWQIATDTDDTRGTAESKQSLFTAIGFNAP
jgi:hypothetical protein